MSRSQVGTDRNTTQRGSALVLALLIAFVVSLLGVSFLMIAQTESHIARNEQLGAQALYAAESAAAAVKRWFDRPNAALQFPDESVIDRSLRRLIDESDPYNAPPLDSSDPSWTLYKQGIDLVLPAGDDLFERPFRGSVEHTLRGTNQYPDMLIAGDPPTAAGNFLETFATTLWGDFPGKGLEARITSIRVFAPPYIEIGSTWSRFGIGTIEVKVRIDRVLDTERWTLARKTVTAVLNEAPYSGPYGPVHSCRDLTMTGTPTAHWGAVTAQGVMKLFVSDVSEVPPSIPRKVPPVAQLDRPWPWPPNPAALEDLEDEIHLEPGLVDPWFRAMAGGSLQGAPNSSEQPFLGPPPVPVDLDHTNLFQNLALVACPEYDYRLWKTVATSGSPDVRYFSWAGTGYQENSEGAIQSFRDWTHGGQGVFFFDTADGRPPIDADNDGSFDNLAPPIALSGGAWSFEGMLYLNAETFQTDGLTGVVTTLNAPGELFLDANVDGAYAPGERYYNLRYADTLAANSFVDKDDRYDENLYPTENTVEVHNAYGPPLSASVSLHGILYTSGRFEATGTARHYGTIVARSGVVQAVADGSAPTPEIYWDASISGRWPPSGWKLPRVITTHWGTAP